MKIVLLGTKRQGGKTVWLKQQIRRILYERTYTSPNQFGKLLIVTPTIAQSKDLAKEFNSNRDVIVTTAERARWACMGITTSDVVIDNLTDIRPKDLEEFLQGILPAMTSVEGATIYITGDSYESLGRLIVSTDERERLQKRVRELEQKFDQIKGIIGQV